MKPRLDVTSQAFTGLLPCIEAQIRSTFRQVPCRHRREDLIQESIAISWKWFRRLVERGKDPSEFIVTLARLAARSVKSGRTVGRQESAKDAMSWTAQYRHGFRVGKMPDVSTLSSNPLNDALHDNTQSEIPDQVSFRVDFPTWLRGHSRRDRAIIDEMMLSARTCDLAKQFRLSPGRISQLRREWQLDWDVYTS